MEQFITENQWIILVAALWSLPWKAWALWRAAQQKQKVWFAIFLLINTLGILEMLYIFIFSKKPKKQFKKF